MTDEKRTPAETEKMAREVMKRMLETPPKVHKKTPAKPRRSSRGQKSK